MRLAIAQPCFGSSEMVLRMSRSRVPCTRSLGFPILCLSTLTIVDSQGVTGLAAWIVARTGQLARRVNSLMVGISLSLQQLFPVSSSSSLPDVSTYVLNRQVTSCLPVTREERTECHRISGCLSKIFARKSCARSGLFVAERLHWIYLRRPSTGEVTCN
jgi:hypothetical protein